MQRIFNTSLLSQVLSVWVDELRTKGKQGRVI